MSRIKHPRVKKDAELKKDHRVYPQEGDKSFRGVWKKKKRRKAKQERAVAKGAVCCADEEESHQGSAATKQPKSLRKTGVVSLKRHLEIKKGEPQMRFASFGYSSERFTR
ncbi:MAG: hypothetical protein U1F71_20805 [Verrucomicrobiaceae bacterium]